MSWHTTDTTHTLAENASFVIAASNLMKKAGKEMTPESLSRALITQGASTDWATITAYDPKFELKKVGQAGTYPDSSDSIVRFDAVDENNNSVDHYCLVADHRAKSIIDSKDGSIKSTATYGLPTGWATYNINKEEDEEEIPVRVETTKIGQKHNVLSGENIWRISQLYRVPVDDILDHNSITDPNEIKAGMQIYIPIAAKEKNHQPVSYELLPTPRPMHVTLIGGAKKWSFGNVRSWTDIKEGNGQLYPQNHNLMIYAIAHVPIGQDVAAYYMDRNDLGDYQNTGMVKYMLGYNWQHLADGHVVTETVVPNIITEEIVEKLESAIGTMKTDELLEELEQEAPIEEPKVSWHDTYRPFDGGPVQYESRSQIMLFDRQGEIAKALPIMSGDAFMISGTFTENNTTYGRVSSVNGRGNLRPDLCFAIQMDNENIYIEDELYNTNMTLAEKINMRKPLSFDEQFTRIVGKEMAKLLRIKTLLSRKNKQRKQ